MYTIVVLTPLSPRSVKISAGGAGGREPDSEGPEMFADELDGALLNLERPGDIQEGGRLARTAKRSNTLRLPAEPIPRSSRLSQPAGQESGHERYPDTRIRGLGLAWGPGSRRKAASRRRATREPALAGGSEGQAGCAQAPTAS